jgi:Holliday junction resolvasome RuvABC endonuclease subunit
MSKDIKVMAIDASTKLSGVSIFINGEYYSSTLLDYSDIPIADDRIPMMCMALLKQMNKEKPNIVYIEDTYAGNNPKTQKQLNKIQGVVYGWCLTHSKGFETVTPTSWRKEIPNFPTKAKRKELKEFSVKYVKQKYGIECNDDVADSILIGEAMIRRYE